MPDRDAEKRHIAQALSSNGYPTRVVKRNWQTPLAHRPASDPVTPRAMMVMCLSPYSAGDPDLFSPTSHPTTDTGKLEGPHPSTTMGGCGLQHPLGHVSQGVCWPDLSDVGSSAERAQESTYKREPGPVCNCGACGSRVACY